MKDYYDVINSYDNNRCDKCEASFSTPESLQEHSLVHDNLKTAEFETLKLKYSKLVEDCQLIRKKVRDQDNAGKFHCLECTANFPTCSGLWVHTYWHKNGIGSCEIGSLQVENAQLVEKQKLSQAKIKIQNNKISELMAKVEVKKTHEEDKSAFTAVENKFETVQKENLDLKERLSKFQFENIDLKSTATEIEQKVIY